MSFCENLGASRAAMFAALIVGGFHFVVGVIWYSLPGSSTGVLIGRPRTAIFSSIDAYEWALERPAGDRILLDLDLELVKLRRDVKGMHELVNKKLPDRFKGVTVCEPYAGTRVSIGKAVETKNFRGFELVVLEGPETKCNGIVYEAAVEIR